jgi:hypothetical protein
MCISDFPSEGVSASSSSASRSAVPAKPLEQLFGRDAFFAIGLVERLEELGFFLWRQAYRRLMIPRQDGDERALGQGQPFDDDLAFYDGPGGYLHRSMITGAARYPPVFAAPCSPSAFSSGSR